MTIKHPTLLAEVVDEWLGVRRLQTQLAGVLSETYDADFIPPSEFYARTYALLLPLATSVLEHVLIGLRDEGAFACQSSGLKAVMGASRKHIPWRAFERVERVRLARNALVHKGLIPVYRETFEALDTLEDEWIAWSILKGRTRYDTAVVLTGEDLYEDTMRRIRLREVRMVSK
jgi:hypothetical protein